MLSGPSFEELFGAVLLNRNLCLVDRTEMKYHVFSGFRGLLPHSIQSLIRSWCKDNTGMAISPYSISWKKGASYYVVPRMYIKLWERFKKVKNWRNGEAISGIFQTKLLPANTEWLARRTTNHNLSLRVLLSKLKPLTGAVPRKIHLIGARSLSDITRIYCETVWSVHIPVYFRQIAVLFALKSTKISPRPVDFSLRSAKSDRLLVSALGLCPLEFYVKDVCHHQSIPSAEKFWRKKNPFFLGFHDYERFTRTDILNAGETLRHK
jgi:hypothetical protein